MEEGEEVIAADKEANIQQAVVDRHTGRIVDPEEDAEQLAPSAIIVAKMAIGKKTVTSGSQKEAEAERIQASGNPPFYPKRQ